MSIQVNDFRWEPGKNDGEYIKLLEESKDEWQKIAMKAISKLKTQKLRIITIEELEDWLEPVYYEDIYSGGRWALIADCQEVYFTFNFVDPEYLKEDQLHFSGYGRLWRCWNKKPTDEQKKAVKWK